MAVIIPNMDMPKGCWGCKCMRTKDPETNYCMLSGKEFDDRLDLLTTRQKDCPLKSTDEMFERIEKSLKFWGKDARVVGEVLAVLDDYKDGE